MCRSLDILKHLPGHEDRQQQYKTFTEDILQRLRPKVQQDVMDEDLSKLLEYIYIYEKLDK